MAYSNQAVVRYDQLQPVNEKALEVIKGIEGANFNALVAPQFYMMTMAQNGQVNLFIKKAGLLHKMEQKFGNKAVIQSEPVTGEELKALRDMDGIKDGQRYFVFKAKVFVPGIDHPFTSYGSASEGNCRNGRLLEMAETRAINRAMRLATNCGFTSEDEYTEKMTYEEYKEEMKIKSPPPAGEDALAMKKAFFAKFREAGYDPKNNDSVYEYVQKITGKHPKTDKMTVEDYSSLISSLDRSISNNIISDSDSNVIDDEIQTDKQKHLLSFLKTYQDCFDDNDPIMVLKFVCQTLKRDDIASVNQLTDKDLQKLIEELEKYKSGSFDVPDDIFSSPAEEIDPETMKAK